VCITQDNDVTAAAAAGEEIDDEVKAKRRRLDDDSNSTDNITDDVDAVADMSWPQCFSTDRLADRQATMPFETLARQT